MSLTRKQIENRRKWIHDLETTDAEQGRCSLGDDVNGFCCMGRMCVVAGIWFDPDAQYPPDKLSLAFGIECNSHYIELPFNLRVTRLASMNDAENLTFKQIAAVIKEDTDIEEQALNEAERNA